MRAEKSRELEVRDLLRREVVLMQQLFDTLQRELQMLLTDRHGSLRCLTDQCDVVSRTCGRVRQERVLCMEELALERGLPQGSALRLAKSGISVQLFDAGTHLAREVATLDAQLLRLEGKILVARDRTEGLLASKRNAG